MKKKIIIAAVVAAVAVAGGTAYWFFMAGKTAPEDQAQAEKKEEAEVEEIVTGDTLEEVLTENPDGPTWFSSRRLEKAHELALEEIVKQKDAELKLMKDETPKAMEKKKVGHSIESWLDRTK